MFDFFLITTFLFFTIYIAWKKIRANKHHDFQTYAVGKDSNFTLTDIVSTLVATYAAGSMVFNFLENVYLSGLYYFIPGLIFVLNIYLCSYIVMRMHEFIGNLSLAEAMGSLYGNTTRLVVAILGIISRLGHIIIQFKVIAYSFTLLFQINSITATLITGCIVIGYTMLGGIKIVVLTDVYQFTIFAILLIFLTLNIFLKIHFDDNLSNHLTNTVLSKFQSLPKWDGKLFFSLNLMFFNLLPLIGFPETFQRFALKSDLQTIKRSFSQSAGIMLIIISLLSWISILLLLSTYQEPLTKKQIIPYLLEHYVGIKFQGLFIVCILALGMSTADSFLHSLSVLFANDIVKVIRKQKEASIQIAAWFTLFIGLTCLLLSFWEKDILFINIIFRGFYISIASVPITLTFMGFRTHKKVIFISMIAGFITASIWSYFYNNATSIFPAVLVNTIVFLSTHYLFGFQGGWKTFSSETPLGQLRMRKQLNRIAFRDYIHNFSLLKYLQNNTIQTYSKYFYFGFYIFFTDFICLHTLDYSPANPYIQQLYITTGIVTLLMPALFTCPIWASKINSKNPIPLIIFWMLILFLTFFSGIMLYILSGFSTIQFILLGLSMFILGFSVDFIILFIIFTLSFAASYFCFQYYDLYPFTATEFLAQPMQIFCSIIVFLSLIRKIISYKHQNYELSERNNILCQRMQQNQKNSS